MLLGAPHLLLTPYQMLATATTASVESSFSDLTQIKTVQKFSRSRKFVKLSPSINWKIIVAESLFRASQNLQKRCWSCCWRTKNSIELCLKYLLIFILQLYQKALQCHLLTLKKRIHDTPLHCSIHNCNNFLQVMALPLL